MILASHKGMTAQIFRRGPVFVVPTQNFVEKHFQLVRQSHRHFMELFLDHRAEYGRTEENAEKQDVRLFTPAMKKFFRKTGKKNFHLKFQTPINVDNASISLK